MSAVEVTVTVRIQSSTLTLEEVSALLGAEPTDGTGTGEPESQGDPNGPRRSDWSFAVREIAEDPMTPAFERLRAILVRLSTVDAVDQTRDVVLALHGREMGNWYTIEPEYVDLLAGAGAGLILRRVHVRS